jgi:hypothetical protein
MKHPQIRETKAQQGTIMEMWIFRPWWEDIYLINPDGMCVFPYVLVGS